MAQPVRTADAVGPARPWATMIRNEVPVTSLAPRGHGVENVQFVGRAKVESRLAKDAELGLSTLVVMVGLDGVVGVGAGSRTRYVLTTQEHVVCPAIANPEFEFTFPMATDEKSPIALVRTGTARFALNVDVETGAVTSLAASLMAL